MELDRRVRICRVVSSNSHWLWPASSRPLLCQPLSVPGWLAAASSPADQGGRSASLYNCAEATGWSMSPSRNSTRTSVPLRGRWCAPQLGPACAPATRSQVPELSSPGALPVSSPWLRCARPPGSGRAPRCQGNCTLMRRSRPEEMGASCAAITTAVRPSGAVGLARQPGASGAAAGRALKLLRYEPCSRSDSPSDRAAWLPRLLAASCSTCSSV